MAATFPIMDISGGIGDNIAKGGQALGAAIQQVGENYANAKAADQTMQWLSHIKDSSGNPVVDPTMLNDFYGKTPGGKANILGIVLSKYALGQQLTYQQQLQQSQGQVTTGVNQATAQAQGEQERKTHLENLQADLKALGYGPGGPGKTAINPGNAPANPVTPNNAPQDNPVTGMTGQERTQGHPPKGSYRVNINGREGVVDTDGQGGIGNPRPFNPKTDMGLRYLPRP